MADFHLESCCHAAVLQFQFTYPTTLKTPAYSFPHAHVMVHWDRWFLRGLLQAAIKLQQESESMCSLLGGIPQKHSRNLTTTNHLKQDTRSVHLYLSTLPENHRKLCSAISSGGFGSTHWCPRLPSPGLGADSPVSGIISKPISIVQ